MVAKSGRDPKESRHDLVDFMDVTTKLIEDQYYFIRKRSGEDPGTAGDQGEENWKELLKSWLPSYYPIVTKGRIIDENGQCSPQIDILVLDPAYPPLLQNHKYYLASGVIGAFECKVTLRREDIFKSVETATKIKRLRNMRIGNPFRDLNNLPIFGLLAHTSCWSHKNGNNKIKKVFSEADKKFVNHPCEMLDFVCVANLSSLSTYKHAFLGNITTFYFSRADVTNNPDGSKPLGDFIARLIFRLGWEDTRIREIAKYFWTTPDLVSQEGAGPGRTWPNSVFSEETITLFEEEAKYNNAPYWDEWDIFPFTRIGIRHIN